MLVVYFDTNIFRHLTDVEEAIVRQAVAAKWISILLSFVNIEELLAALGNTPEDEVLPRIRPMLSLVDRSRFLKDAPALLTDDIRSYAEQGKAASPFLSGDDLFHASANTEILLFGNAESSRAARLRIARGAKEQKAQFLYWMKSLRPNMSRDAESIRGRVSFEDLWQSQSASFAEHYAKSVGVLEGCKRRGFEGLLKLNSVRMAAGIAMSYGHAKILQEHPQTAKLGDLGDLHHAVLAAARASVFVTRDERLRTLAARVPIERFRVLAFGEFLDSLG